MYKKISLGVIIIFIIAVIVFVTTAIIKGPADSDYEIDQYVVLPENYQNMELTNNTDYSVTEDQLIAYTNKQLQSFPCFKEVEKDAAYLNDMIIIDMVATAGDTVIQEYSDYECILGDGSLYTELETEINGMSKGETKEITAKIPEGYYETDETEAVYKVTLKNIGEEYSLTYDELTDEYVQKYLLKDSVDALLNSYESALATEKENQRIKDNQELLFESIVTQSQITIPQNKIDERYTEQLIITEQVAHSYNIELKEYVKTVLNNDSLDSYKKQLGEEIKDLIQYELVLEQLASENNIKLAETDFINYLEEYTKVNGYNNSNECCVAKGSKEVLRIQYYKEKVLPAIMANAKVNHKVHTTSTKK